VDTPRLANPKLEFRDGSYRVLAQAVVTQVVLSRMAPFAPGELRGVLLLRA
jgi:hypothetical protein